MTRRIGSKATAGLALIMAIIAGACPANRAAAQTTRPSDESLRASVSAHATPRPAWKVAALDGGRVVYAGYDGGLFCHDLENGEVRWRADVGGFPFDLKTADVNGDGAAEVLVSSSDLHLYAFAADGERLWRATPDHPMLGFDVARSKGGEPRIAAAGIAPHMTIFDGEGEALRRTELTGRRSIRDVLCGNFVGDGAAEAWAMRQWGVMYRVPIDGGEHTRLGRPGRMLRKKGITKWDHNGDGRHAVLVAEGTSERTSRKERIYQVRLTLLDGEQNKLWQRTHRLPTPTHNVGYANPRVAVGDLTGDGAPEAAIAQGPSLFVVDQTGEPLYVGNAHHRHFTDLSVGPGHRLILGSGVGISDRNIYTLELAEDGPDQFAKLRRAHNAEAKIMENLRRLRQRVLEAPAHPDAEKRQYRITLSGTEHASFDTFKKLYPYDNVRFMGIYGGAHDPSERADDFESANLDHHIQVSHGLDHGRDHELYHMFEEEPVQTLERYFEMASNTARGIQFSETSHLFRPDRDEPATEYVHNYMIPMMDAARRHNKEIVLWQKQAWYALIPARPRYRGIFAKRFQPHILARTEESNSRCPEINYMSRIGLWRTGLIGGWSANMIGDLWRPIATGLLEYEYKSPTGILRQLIAANAAGARDYRLQFGFGIDVEEDGEPAFDTPLGLALDTFVHMLGKGLITAPTRDELRGLSDIAIRMHEPHPGMLWQQHGNWEPFEKNEQAKDGLLSGWWWWGLRPAHDKYLSKHILGVDSYSHDFIPETPYGLPVIVPHWIDDEKLSWASKVIDTDGVHVLEDGEKHTSGEKLDEVLQAFREQRSSLLFSAGEGVYCMARHAGGDRFQVTLVDPGLFNHGPKRRDVTLRVNDGAYHEVRDAITGEAVKASGDTLQLTIPAGTFRGLHATLDR